MSKLIVIVALFLLGWKSTVNAQESTVDVNKDIAITKVYEQVVKEGYGTPKVYLDLANAYYFEGDYASAKKWYEKVFETEKSLATKVVLFRYKQSLKALKLSFRNNKYLALAQS